MSFSALFRALRARCIRLADAFLFDHRSAVDAEERWRIRVAALFICVATVASLTFSLLYAGIEGGLGSNARSLLLVTVLFLSMLGALRYTRQHRAASAVALLAAYGMLFFTAFLDGPLSPPSVAWHALLPILGGLLVGVSGALLVLGLIAAEVLVFYVLIESGFAFPTSVAPQTEEVLTLWSVLGAAVVSALIGGVYEATRRRMQQRLRRTTDDLHRAQEARYEALIQQTAEAICFVDPETKRIEEVNPAFLNLLGYRVDEVTALHLCDVTEETPAEVEQRIEYTRTGRISHAEHQWVTQNGARVEVQVTYNLIQQAGRPMLYVVARDVTQRKEAQRALRRSEKRYRSLMRSANDAIYIANADTGLIVDANRQTQDLTGRPLDDLTGRRPIDFLPAADRARSAEFFERLRTHETVRTDDLCVVHADGRHIPVEISANVIELEGTTFVQGILRDITNRKHYEEALVQAKEQAEEMSRLKSSLLANVSHEVRTPLTSIAGFADVLSEEVADEHAEFVHLIQESSTRLMDTLDGMLSLAHPGSDVRALAFEPTNVADLAREVIADLEPQAQKKDLSVALDLPAAAAPVATADPIAARRVLRSVVANAVKFTPAGDVTVTLHVTSGEVVVQVADTGIGISKAFLPQVFDEFKQESTGLSREHEGCGLGLTIAQRLMKRMGGRIEIESTKGAGSTVTICFARAETPAQPKLTRAGAAAP